MYKGGKNIDHLCQKDSHHDVELPRHTIDDEIIWALLHEEGHNCKNIASCSLGPWEKKLQSAV